MNKPIAMTRVLAALFLMAMLGASPLRAQEKTSTKSQDEVEFALVQSRCVQTSTITFGPQGRWKDCRLVRAGFVATIGLQDFFYAEYCLLNAGKRCAKQAQVMYRNRAYKNEAFLDVARIDPPGTLYQPPLLVGTDKENVLAMAVRLPGRKNDQRRYFRYAQAQWKPIDSEVWLKDLSTRLPDGLALRTLAQDALPDPQTMTLRLPLYRGGDRDCCAKGGSVEVRLQVDAGRFEIAELNFTSNAPK